MARYIIYGLSEPDTGFLRYVGLTTRSLQARFQGHWSTRNCLKTHTASWLNSLDFRGLKPIIETIDSFDSIEELFEAEAWYIEYFRSLGCNLTNLVPGGQKISFGHKNSYNFSEKMKGNQRGKGNKSRTGQTTSEETRSKLSAALMGNKRTLGIKLSEKTKSKMRKSSPRRKPVIDSIGNIFCSLSDAAKFWKIGLSSIKAAIKKNRPVYLINQTFTLLENP